MINMTYSVLKKIINSIDYIELKDSYSNITVKIVPSIGNLIFSIKKKGEEYLWVPGSLDTIYKEFILCGIPFLAPWANRLDDDVFYINNRKYKLNPFLQLRRDSNNKPIHGLLLFSSHWKVNLTETTQNYASITSQLAFWQYPEYLSNFPFPHNIRMTIKLENGVIEVQTIIENLSAENLPISIGFHPYFQLPDIPYEDWELILPSCKRAILDQQLIPTGEYETNPYTSPIKLTSALLDDVFVNLNRDSFNNSSFILQGSNRKIEVIFGEKFKTAIIYAPIKRKFVCIEPMSAITNAFNLAHKGVYSGLDSVAPNSEWEAKYWIKIA